MAAESKVKSSSLVNLPAGSPRKRIYFVRFVLGSDGGAFLIWWKRAGNSVVRTYIGAARCVEGLAPSCHAVEMLVLVSLRLLFQSRTKGSLTQKDR